MGLTIFGFGWVIYESLTIGLFQKVAELDLRICEQQQGPLKEQTQRAVESGLRRLHICAGAQLEEGSQAC